MAEKIFNGRIVQKHDTAENWAKATSFVPKQAEVIVYDKDSTYNYERFKIGDGTTNVNSLPFVDDALRTALLEQINAVDDKVDAVSTLVGDTKVSDQISTAVDVKMDKVNPTGTGAFSLNRKADTTVGDYSFAEGRNTEASSSYAHAEGYTTRAIASASHAEGNSTQATGLNSHAEGDSTIASGASAHAEGYATETRANYAHAEGMGTIAGSVIQHTQGKYNIVDSSKTYSHIVGNGEDNNNRSNAHTLDWSGNAWYSGDVYVGSTSGKNKDDGSKKLATEDYVDELVGDTSVSEQIAAAQLVYVGPTAPTDPNIKVWINTAEEGTGVVPVLPRIATITLAADSWTGASAPYGQEVTINTVTSATKIDLQPTVAQIVSLQDQDIALMAENIDGVVTIYSFGGKPSADMTMQVLLQEVAFV